MSYAASGVIIQYHRQISVSIFMVKITASEVQSLWRGLLEGYLESVSNF